LNPTPESKSLLILFFRKEQNLLFLKKKILCLRSSAWFVSSVASRPVFVKPASRRFAVAYGQA
jgi:hypothetical protein